MAVAFGDPRLPERYWAKVQQTPTCWLWTAAKSEGYGNFGIGRSRTQRAHRLAWLTLVGDIPSGMVVDHTCRVRACVNPAHMHIVTRKQNIEHRGLDRNNTSGARGVSWTPHVKMWRVGAEQHGVNHFGGYFHDFAEAEEAAIALRNRLFTNNLLDR